MAGTTDLEKLIAVYIQQIQELEQMWFELIDERTLDAALGAQLNGVGGIVGEERFGRNDDDYRVAIRGRIRLNRSNGTSEDIIAVLKSQLGDKKIVMTEDSYPSHFEVFIPDYIDFLAGSMSSGSAELYALVHLYELHVSVNGAASQIIIFDAADFANIGAATADEVAAVINANLSGGNALNDSGRILLRSNTLGDTSSIQVTGGTANAILDFDFGNLTLATTLSGGAETDVVVSAAISTFVPESGILSIELDSGAYAQVAYTSYTGSTFTIESTDFAGDNATTPKIVAVAIVHTGPEAAQAFMVRVSNTMQEARSAAIKGILFWNTCSESFGFLGTSGALGFTEGCFASALDV